VLLAAASVIKKTARAENRRSWRYEPKMAAAASKIKLNIEINIRLLLIGNSLFYA